ncbi:MAG TPA: hypothetical protein VEL47_04500 [Myxococcota bacterium]|nr:hypothetical protein [Myxococcota bacterium]
MKRVRTSLTFLIVAASLNLTASQVQSGDELIDIELHDTSEQIADWLEEKILARGPFISINYWISRPPAGLINEITDVYFSLNGKKIYFCSSNERVLVYDLTSQEGYRIDRDNIESSAIRGSIESKGIYTEKFVLSPDKTYTLHITHMTWPACYFEFSIKVDDDITDLTTMNLTSEQKNLLGIIEASENEERVLDLTRPERRPLLLVFKTLPPTLQLYLSHFGYVRILKGSRTSGWLDYYGFNDFRRVASVFWSNSF